ncbi:MAG TPA: lmo0937 family membrane protein [Candidatus Saccharimonadia bacterium]|nr:lmo0937 family membrane protein [Candidatus Saccharimonadia bacterium]
MLLTIAIILGILWLLGIVVIHIASPLFHLILVIAIIILIYDLMVRRRRA